MSDECLLFTLLDTFTDGDGQFPNQIFELTTLRYISTLSIIHTSQPITESRRRRTRKILV